MPRLKSDAMRSSDKIQQEQAETTTVRLCRNVFFGDEKTLKGQVVRATWADAREYVKNGLAEFD